MCYQTALVGISMLAALLVPSVTAQSPPQIIADGNNLNITAADIQFLLGGVFSRGYLRQHHISFLISQCYFTSIAVIACY